MNPKLLLPAITTALLLTSGLRAQDPALAQGLLDELRVPLHEATSPDDGRVEIWAAGSDYKVSFHDGLRFVPRPSRLGDEVTPWRWRTAAIRVDGIARPVAKAPRPTIAGSFRCELELGPAVEAYDLHAQGVEQSFVLHTRIDGELEIEGVVDSALTTPARDAAHQALEFGSDRSATSVRYGAATAIDAGGRALALTTSVAGDRVTLRVPGDWLAAAAYPVVVDPLLQAVVVDGQAAPVTGISIERDHSRTSWNLAVAVSRSFSATDEDVFLFVCQPGFAARTLVFSQVTLGAESDPDVGMVLPAGRWMLAYSRWNRIVDSEQVWLHQHALTNLAFDSTTTQLASPNGGRQRRAAVGGTDFSTQSAPLALIVREVEPPGTAGETNATAIWGSLIDPTSGATTHVRIGSASSQDGSRPSVSRSHDGHSWMVAWQRLASFGAARYGVLARHVYVDGHASGGAFFTDRATLPEHLLAPVVDGRSGRYLIAFASAAAGGLPPSGDAGESLWVQRFDWRYSLSAPSATAPSNRIAFGSGGRFFRVQDVAQDRRSGSHWAVVHSIDSLLGRYLSLSVLGYRGRERDRHVLGYDGAFPAAVAFDQDAQRFAIAYAQLVGTQHRALGRLWEYPAQNAPSTAGVGCGQATIDAGEQRFLIGNEGPSVELERAPAGVPAWLLVSLAPSDQALDPFGIAGCRLLVEAGPLGFVTALGATTSTSGIARITLPLPEDLQPGDLFFQWVHADPGAAGGLRLTPRLEVELR